MGDNLKVVGKNLEVKNSPKAKLEYQSEFSDDGSFKRTIRVQPRHRTWVIVQHGDRFDSAEDKDLSPATTVTTGGYRITAKSPSGNWRHDRQGSVSHNFEFIHSVEIDDKNARLSTRSSVETREGVDTLVKLNGSLDPVGDWVTLSMTGGDAKVISTGQHNTVHVLGDSGIIDFELSPDYDYGMKLVLDGGKEVKIPQTGSFKYDVAKGLVIRD